MQAFFSRKVPSFHARGKKRAPFGVLVRHGAQDARGPMFIQCWRRTQGARSHCSIHFPGSTAPQAFPHPDRRMPTPARAGCVKAGRTFAATPAAGRGSALTHPSTMARSIDRGLTDALPFFSCRSRGSIGSAGCIVLYVVELSSPHHGLQEHRRRNVRHGIEPVAKRIARSPRPVPAGTTFRREGSEWA